MNSLTVQAPALHALAKQRAISDIGLVLPMHTTRDEWEEIARNVVSMQHGVLWWIGDLAAFAMQSFPEPDDAIMVLATATGYGRKRIRLLAHIAKQYPVAQRVHGLSVSHHAMVARFSPAKRQRRLAYALKHGLSTRDMVNVDTPVRSRKVTFIVTMPARRGPAFEKHLARYKDEFAISRIIPHYPFSRGRQALRSKRGALLPTSTLKPAIARAT